jgi:hypothetical protein
MKTPIAIVGLVAMVACSTQPIDQKPTAFGEALNASLKGQTIRDGEGTDLSPTARELRGVGEPDRGPSYSTSQESMTAPSTSGGGGGNGGGGASTAR